MSKPFKKERKHKGLLMVFFSLVELLVVISIIALLTSILLPALKNAKETGKRIVCTNNLKQIYQGASLYTLDNDGYLPMWKYWPDHVADSLGIYNFDPYKHYSTASYNSGVFLCPNTAAPGNPNLGWVGTYNNEKCHTSYGTTEVATSKDSVTDPQGGWNLYTNSYLAGKGKKLKSVIPGSVLLIEKTLNGLSWGIAICYQYNYYWHTTSMDIVKGAHYRHVGNTANFLFVDGHVRNLKAYSQIGANWIPKD